MASWYASRIQGGYPVIVAEQTGAVVGYASYGPFRSGEGYAATVEHTAYVRREARRQGIARGLLERLIGIAKSQDRHLMIGGVSADQEASLSLHRALGFREAGRLPGAGRKFGRWLDLTFMVREIDG